MNKKNRNLIVWGLFVTIVLAALAYEFGKDLYLLMVE